MIDFDSSDDTRKKASNVIFSSCDSIDEDKTIKCDGKNIDEYRSVAAPNEQQMLINFLDYMYTEQPTVITGYNVKNFDLGYIYDRLLFHKLLLYTSNVNLSKHPWESRRGIFTTNQSGTRETRNFKLLGFIIIDIYEFVIGTYKLNSYKLDNVATHFLKDKQKINFPYSNIDIYYRSKNAEKQLELLEYCCVDAYLCTQLFSVISLFNNLESLAIVTGVPIRFVLERGQQVRIMTLIERELIIRKQDNFIFPLLNLINFLEWSNEKKDSQHEKYAGAHVVQPKANYYTTPVCTLDFASLYPSLMSGFNMCYSTLVDENYIEHLDLLSDTKCDEFIKENVCIERPGCVKPFLEKDVVVNKMTVSVTQTPYVNKKIAFVKSSVQRGVLPGILDNLLAKRKRVRVGIEELEQKGAPKDGGPDAEEKFRLQLQVMNSMQLALKLTANSIYGSTGAVTSKLPCIDIASSVTAHGRFNLDIITKATELYKWEKILTDGTRLYNNGESNVVYGDTDSIMIVPGGNIKNVEYSLIYGMEMADLCSKMICTPPIKLEFEKVYMPYLLLRKKNYVGLMWTNAKKYKKIDAKGIKTARRDTIPLVKVMLDEIINLLMFNSSLDMKDVEKCIIDLLKKNMLLLKPADTPDDYMPQPTMETIRSLIISKKYSKENYSGAQPHATIAKRSLANPLLRPFAVGERIAFVILNRRNEPIPAKISDRAFSIEEFELEPQNFVIDIEYYAKSVFLSPLISLPLYASDELNAVWFGKVCQVMCEHFPLFNFIKLLPPKYKKFLVQPKKKVSETSRKKKVSNPANPNIIENSCGTLQEIHITQNERIEQYLENKTRDERLFYRMKNLKKNTSYNILPKKMKQCETNSETTIIDTTSPSHLTAPSTLVNDTNDTVPVEKIVENPTSQSTAAVTTKNNVTKRIYNRKIKSVNSLKNKANDAVENKMGVAKRKYVRKNKDSDASLNCPTINIKKKNSRKAQTTISKDILNDALGVTKDIGMYTIGGTKKQQKTKQITLDVMEHFFKDCGDDYMFLDIDDKDIGDVKQTENIPMKNDFGLTIQNFYDKKDDDLLLVDVTKKEIDSFNNTENKSSIGSIRSKECQKIDDNDLYIGPSCSKRSVGNQSKRDRNMCEMGLYGGPSCSKQY